MYVSDIHAHKDINNEINTSRSDKQSTAVFQNLHIWKFPPKGTENWNGGEVKLGFTGYIIISEQKTIEE